MPTGLVGPVSVAGVNWFSHDYAPRMLDGEPVGLNQGLVGLGADASRTHFDNLKVQVLLPELTLEHEENFADGVADLLTEPQNGSWAVVGSGKKSRYEATVGAGQTGWSLADLGTSLQPSSYLSIDVTLSTDSSGGIIYDRYADDDYKFVTVDAERGRLLFGHVDPKHGYQIDKAVDWSFEAGRDYDLSLTFQGSSVSMTVNGAMVGSYSYNSVAVDGGFGLLTQGGSTSFDWLRIRTDDQAFGALGPNA